MSDSTVPGLTLQEWLDLEGLSYSAFSRLVPCAVSYPRLLAHGLQRPSYEMACRIETITGGQVSREQWFPRSPMPVSVQTSTVTDIPNLESLLK